MDDSVKKYFERRDARLKKRMDAEFREGDHPRDENGRFTSGGGGKGKVIKSAPSWPKEQNAPAGEWNYSPQKDRNKWESKEKRHHGNSPYFTMQDPEKGIYKDRVGDYAKKKPETMEWDFDREGFKKNNQGRWVKK